MSKVKSIYIDGSINGWDCATCVFLADAADNQISKELNIIPGRNKGENRLTVCEAEYRALFEALPHITPERTVYSDSIQLVNEITGIKEPSQSTLNEYYKIKNWLERSKEDGVITDIKDIKIEWISRDKNLAGIYLEKRLRQISKSYNQVLHPTFKQNNKKEWKKMIYGRRRN